MRDTVEMHHGKCVCVSFLTRPIQGLKTQDILAFAALLSSICAFFLWNALQTTGFSMLRKQTYVQQTVGAAEKNLERNI